MTSQAPAAVTKSAGSRAKPILPKAPQSLLERLVTHPDAFGLTEATPLQRAVCRCIDGVALGELADEPDVQWAFGGPEAIAALPVGVMPAEVILCAAVRGAKTLISSALAFKNCLTVDLSPTRRNEAVRYSIASIDKDKAGMAVQHLNDTIPHARLLRPYFLRSSQNVVMVRHPSGRPIEIKVIVAGRGGGGVVSRWSAGVACDEAPRMQGQGAVVNLPDLLKAAHGRILPGAQIFMPGSPWAPAGPIYDAVQDEWGKPSRGRVVIRGKGPMLNPLWWTAERIKATLALKDGELIVQTECEAEFGTPESFFFTTEQIKRAMRELPLKVGYDPAWTYAAFMDPATRGNAWTVVIVGKLPGDTEADAKYVVAYAHEWRGTKTSPQRAKAVFEELAPVLAEYGLSSVSSDGWSVDTISEVAAATMVDGRPMPIVVELDEASQEDKDRRYIDFRELLIADPEPLISLPPDKQVRADLVSVRRVLTPNGMRFPLPKTGDGRHADYAPSLVGAVDKARAATAGWMTHMRRARAAGHLGPTRENLEASYDALGRRMQVGR